MHSPEWLQNVRKPHNKYMLKKKDRHYSEQADAGMRTDISAASLRKRRTHRRDHLRGR